MTAGFIEARNRGQMRVDVKNSHRRTVKAEKVSRQKSKDYADLAEVLPSSTGVDARLEPMFGAWASKSICAGLT